MTRFEQIETPRLVIRRFRATDAPGFAAYRSLPGVARYQSWDAPYPLDRATAFIAELAGAEPGTPGMWFQFAIEERATGGLVGDCALQVDRDDPTCGELGFTLDPACQGKGYATEAAAALVDLAHRQLGVDRVVAVTDGRNDRSIAVLERLGFSRGGTERTTFKGEACEEHTYELVRRMPA